LRCAGRHRGLGVHLSFVRSTTMDSWSPLQIAKMRVGGNTKLKNFFSSQKFPANLSIKEKFDNDAMEKYRERLTLLAKGKLADEIEHIGYISRQPQPKKKFSSQMDSSGLSRGGAMGSRPHMSSLSGGTDLRKPSAHEWGLDSWMSTIQKKSSQVVSTVTKGTADVTTKLQKGMGDVGQQLKEKDIGSQISSGWNLAMGWASKTVKNISEVIKDDDRIKLYNKDAIRAPSNSKKMESKSSKDYFLGGDRAISSNSYFENTGGLSSNKPKVTKPSKAADAIDHFGFSDKGERLGEPTEIKLPERKPSIDKKAIADTKKSKNNITGHEPDFLDGILGGVNNLNYKKGAEVLVDSTDEDDTWEW